MVPERDQVSGPGTSISRLPSGSTPSPSSSSVTAPSSDGLALTEHNDRHHFPAIHPDPRLPDIARDSLAAHEYERAPARYWHAE
jgi:hypothetical protein